MNRLTLNLGAPLRQVRRHAAGAVGPGGTVRRGRARCPSRKCINQSIAVWRAGASYDLTGNGRTALKASYSRYGLQVGIDRVTNVNPLTVGSARLPVERSERRRQVPDVAKINVAHVPGVQRRHRRPSTRRRRQVAVLGRGDGRRRNAAARRRPRRRDVLLPHQPRADRPAQHAACRRRAYTPFTITIPNGPGGTRRQPEADDGRRSTTSSRAGERADDNIRDNEDYLDTDYKGVEFTATKRFSKKWQMQAGFTIGKNSGGVNRRRHGQSPTQRPERPEHHAVPGRHHRQRLASWRSACRAATRCRGTSTSPGSMIANNGYPYVSTYSLTARVAGGAGHHADPRHARRCCSSERGDERYRQRDDVRHAPVATFRFGSRSIHAADRLLQHRQRRHDASLNNGGRRHATCSPGEILSPRIIRVGLRAELLRLD